MLSIFQLDITFQINIKKTVGILRSNLHHNDHNDAVFSFTKCFVPKALSLFVWEIAEIRSVFDALFDWVKYSIDFENT